VSQFFAKLPWLEQPPADFSARCRQYGAGEGSATDIAQRLASFGLNTSQSAMLGRAMAKRRARGDQFSGMASFKLGVLASATADLLVDCIPAAAARHGVNLEILTSPYDQVMQQAFDPASIMNTGELDGVLVLIDHRWLQIDKPLSGHDPTARVADAIGRLRTVVSSLRQHGGMPSLLTTVPAPPEALFGSYDIRTRDPVRSLVADFNRKLVDLVEETGSYVLDMAGLAERIGTDVWFDPVQWAAYKSPFAAHLNPAVADVIGRLLGAIRGKSRKCLVLDLDNTIWGGAIGDEGVEGIQLAQGSATGESFLAVQQMAMALRSRGIMLAVCSKNTDEVARQPFRQHPEMLLREQHITVFQANWLDKPSNIEAIARTLNIGLDALVFLDDNPVERAQVRAALPMVAVPELPTDPSYYPRTLSAAGYFEATSFSDEDRLRVESYTSDAKRAEVMTKTRDLGEYLAALEMTLSVKPFDRQGRQRIVQLINKTNQFNLTTRRYTDAEVEAMWTDPSVYSLQARLQDKFGDLGMIGVVIGRDRVVDRRRVREIDTWLMSCRVLGRKVEETMLAEVVAAAAGADVYLITATYIPTSKNHMVKDFFKRLGFSDLGKDEKGVSHYELRVSDYAAPPLPLKVIRSVQELAAAE
jgi:FkbH-like protein